MTTPKDSDGLLDPALWGELPAAEQRMSAFSGNDALLRGKLVTAIADSEEIQLAALHLAASPEQLGEWICSGQLFAFRADGLLLIPIWQFASAGPDGLLSGLPELLAAHPTARASFWSWWMRQPSGELEDRTPLEAIRAGQLAAVTAALRLVAARV